MSIRYTTSAESLLATVVAGLAIVAPSVLDGHDYGRFLAPGWYMVTLVPLMTLEILTCWVSTHKQKKFKWASHIQIKFLLWGFVFIGLVLDSFIIMAVLTIPPSILDPTSLPFWGTGFLPVTFSVLLWLNTAEIVQSISNIAKRVGAKNIPPTLLWAVAMIRKFDRLRAPPGTELNKRDSDHIATLEHVEELLETLKDRGEMIPPPPPLGKGSVDNIKKENPKNG